MTKEEYAKSRIEVDFDEFQYWVVSNYNVDDIDLEVFEKAINDAIYNGYLIYLYQDDDGTWLVEDYQMLSSDIQNEIIRSLKLE